MTKPKKLLAGLSKRVDATMLFEMVDAALYLGPYGV
jgi:hypothetical protein